MAELSTEAKAVLQEAVALSAHHGEAAEKLAEEVVELRKVIARMRPLVSRGYVRKAIS